MNSRLLNEFQEFEGLENYTIDVPIDELIENEPDSGPANVATLTSTDVYHELDKRGIKNTGFLDADKERLQAAFNEEYNNSLEERKQKKIEKAKKMAQQLNLQKKRLLMEKLLQEEEEELIKNYHISQLILLIKQNSTTFHTNLRINNINSILIRSFSKAMWINTTIISLDLSNNNLNDHAGIYIAKILKKNNTIKKLELDNNNFSINTCYSLSESLKINTSLIYLSLDSNPLVLKSSNNLVNTSLALNLNSNDFNQIIQVSNLDQLDIKNFIQNNQNSNSQTEPVITEEKDYGGFQALCESLAINKSLTVLNLFRTGLEEIGGKALLNGILNNNNILSLDIGHNGILTDDIIRINEKLDSNLKLHEEKARYTLKNEIEKNLIEKKLQEEIQTQEKQRNVLNWLQLRREERNESRRESEEIKIIKLQEELAERKRLLEIQKEEERKAAEEAAKKKAKKKDKDKKNKK